MLIRNHEMTKCTHLDQVNGITPRSPEGSEAYLAIGDTRYVLDDAAAVLFIGELPAQFVEHQIVRIEQDDLLAWFLETEDMRTRWRDDEAKLSPSPPRRR